MLKKSFKPVAMAAGMTLVGSLAGFSAAQADTNPFGMTALSSGYMALAAVGEGKCGGDKKDAEGKCGGDKKDGEGKCGEGKCGGDKKDGEGKCGEGKCGGEKEGEGKCGEGKCGGDKDKKPGEGALSAA